MAFLLRVKWPMLRTILVPGFAIGFTVSVAQFIATQFLKDGRVNTATTEAIALSVGSQRTSTAANAWLQWLLPAWVMTLATGIEKPRRFTRP